MSETEELARTIIKQAEHDPANVMMLGEVAPIARSYLSQTERVKALEEALRGILDMKMGRGDGVVGDYIEDIHETARAALQGTGT